VVFRGDTWRSGSVSLRRAHKDPRARKQLWALAGLILSPFFLLGYVMIVTHDFDKEFVGPAVVGWLGALIGIALVSWFRSRHPYEKDGPVTLDLSPRQQIPNPPSLNLSPELHREFAERALLLAVLADRSGSERFIQTKILPEGMEVVTRQRHLALLRDRGLYERIGSIERYLLLAADGHWPSETIENMTLMLEPLRILRWVLRVDTFLPTIGAHLIPDYKLSFTLIQDPNLLFTAVKFVEISDLRIALAAADQYLYRCWAEGLQRGLFTADDPENDQRAREYAARLSGNESDDLLLGATIVSKSPDDEIRFATNLSLRRFRTLDWVRSRMYGEVPVATCVEAFFL